MFGQNEINASELLWLHDNQKNITQSKNYSQLEKSLVLITDENGLFHSRGRLQNAPLPYDSREPILLNNRHYLTELIVQDAHYKILHNGVKQILTHIRERFWICRGRSYVKGILSKCLICKKLMRKPYDYPESPPLPSSRLRDDFAFSSTGLDLYVPIFVKNIYHKQDETMHKAFITMYTCASTRNIYLDIVSDPSSKVLIRNLQRFICHRGCPNMITTDNGSNFIADETQRFASDKNIMWDFNLQAAPWYRGFFERCVKLVKVLLRKTLGGAKLFYDEMLTVSAEVEVVLNNRLLTYVYAEETECCLHLITCCLVVR